MRIFFFKKGVSPTFSSPFMEIIFEILKCDICIYIRKMVLKWIKRSQTFLLNSNRQMNSFVLGIWWKLKPLKASKRDHKASEQFLLFFFFSLYLSHFIMRRKKEGTRMGTKSWKECQKTQKMSFYELHKHVFHTRKCVCAYFGVPELLFLWRGCMLARWVYV